MPPRPREQKPDGVSGRTWALYRQAIRADDLRDLSEDQYQAWIEVAALRSGWRLQFHVRRSKVKGQWVTNTSSPGVPDLWLLRPSTGQLVVFEVKSQKGRPSAEQLDWIASLQRAGIDAYIVKPSDAKEVLALLARPLTPVPESG